MSNNIYVLKKAELRFIENFYFFPPDFPQCHREVYEHRKASEGILFLEFYISGELLSI